MYERVKSHNRGYHEELHRINGRNIQAKIHATQTFMNMNSTELSKYIWQLRDSKKDFNIKWTIICRARPYSNITKRCDLCTTEKLMLINSKPDELLNKRSELISKCRH